MDFFGIGFGEGLLVLLLALIIWGPKRLPEIARTVGKTMRMLRKAANDFTSQVTREVDIEEAEHKATKPPTQPEQDAPPPSPPDDETRT
jgi:sec-independent protein translocase protein TatA